MYKVQKLAEIAGVSVRTLHHYDQIGLLKPGIRSEAGYRMYGEAELLRLQQILFFKELDFPLKEIGAILDKPGFDVLEALSYHKKMIEEKLSRTSRLLRTIDTTIQKITEENVMKNEDELFEGFSKKQQEEYEKEARERWGDDKVAESKERTKNWSKEKFKDIADQQNAIPAALASKMHLDAGHPDVQKIIQQHFDLIGQFYTVTPEIYRGLGELYTTDDRFREFYDKHKPGMADFMKSAMNYFADEKFGREH
jgi:DNA-binding transcriptional MerR regulator